MLNKKKNRPTYRDIWRYWADVDFTRFSCLHDIMCSAFKNLKCFPVLTVLMCAAGLCLNVLSTQRSVSPRAVDRWTKDNPDNANQTIRKTTMSLIERLTPIQDSPF